MQAVVPNTKYRQVWQQIFESAGVKDPVKRRNGSLAAALAFAEATLLVVAFLWTGTVTLLVLAGISFSAYALSRMGYVRFATAILVLELSVWYVFFIANDPALTGEGVRTLFAWSVLPMLLSSSFLVLSDTFWVGMLNIGVMFLVPVIIPRFTTADVFATIGLPTTALALILVSMRHRDGVERIRQSALQQALDQVRESEAKLEIRVLERTKELEQKTVELEAAKIEAERANNVKSQFLAVVSHELRTPLNGIINFSAFVHDGFFGPINEKQKNALGDVIKAGNHLLALINDVLDISKIESGSLRLFIESDIDLNAELDDLIRSSQPLLGSKSVQFVREIGDGLPRITGDRRRIRQIMMNIVSNACKFTEAGTITVGAEAEGDQVHLWVKDTGPGIRDTDHESVFETFKQTDAGLRSGSGTGLGMPISRRLAEAHGGKLWLESTVGQGSTFHVMLPIHAVLDSAAQSQAVE